VGWSVGSIKLYVTTPYMQWLLYVRMCAMIRNVHSHWYKSTLRFVCRDSAREHALQRSKRARLLYVGMYAITHNVHSWVKQHFCFGMYGLTRTVDMLSAKEQQSPFLVCLSVCNHLQRALALGKRAVAPTCCILVCMRCLRRCTCSGQKSNRALLLYVGMYGMIRRVHSH